MRSTLVGCCTCVVLLLCANAARAQVDVVPEPQHVVAGQGAFALQRGERIVAPADARAQWIAGFLRDAIDRQSGIRLRLAQAPARGRIALRIDRSIKGDEAYRLDVTPAQVVVAASGNRGLFWGVQTLRQLLPVQRERPATIPAVQIEDAPRYPWRGVMLDVSRHFYPVDFVKRQIDLMSYYKFNVFHWHLTDDQGWRIQIRRYPKLTQVGAFRTEADGSRDGGFYTRQQIREVVAYARERNVMVVPEIEMPGHASAAIAAYPELSCSGKPTSVPATWGVFGDVDCVGKDSTYAFLENVLDEVIALFPSPYLHIGGDEVPEGAWDGCHTCARLAAAKGFRNNEQGLHGYFVGRIGRFLASRGKTLVGWDEILEGGVSPNAVVEVWHLPSGAYGGSNATLESALSNGNRVIIAGPFYLDTPIDRMTLEDLYRTRPFDDPLFARYPGKVLGGDAPLWSERATPRNGAARLYPRLLAIAEHFWNPGAHDYDDFLRRARVQEAWLTSRHVAIGPEDRDIADYQLTFNPAYQRWRIRAARGFDDLRLHYTLDGGEPTTTSPSFGDVLDLYAPAPVTVAPFRGDVPYQASRKFGLVANLALGKPVTYATPPDARYSGGPLQLVNGILGDNDFEDGAWDGWQDQDMDAMVDLQRPTVLHSISVRFLQLAEASIVLPVSVAFEASNDGKAWTTLQTVPLVVDPDNNLTFIHAVAFKPALPVTARFVRVVAARYGKPVNGSKAWIFTDEIDVQ